MGISEYGFSTPVDYEAETAQYKKQIGGLAGLPKTEVIELEGAELLEYIRGREASVVPNDLTRKYLSQAIGVPGAIPTLQYLLSALVNDMGGLTSYGTAMDFYQKTLKDFVPSSKRNEHHSALLAGAACAISMIEFVAGVRSILPNADCLTIDTDPTNKPVYSSPSCPYQTMDARDLPFRQMFDSIHTNGLLDHLVDPLISQATDSPELSRGRQRFFGSSVRALKPGGMLVMVERLIDPAAQPIFQPFIGELFEAGFETIALAPVYLFRTRRYLDRYLRNTTLEISPSSLFPSNRLIGFVAKLGTN